VADTLYELLHDCTVKLILTNGECGTGFFVAPGRVLTCEHVVRRAEDAPIAMRWRQIHNFAEARVEQVWAEIDLALLTFEPPQSDLPCVYLDDEDVRVGDQLYLFGYPDREYENGRPVTPECEGFTGDEPPFIMLEQGQVQPGMSGAALLNRRTGKVCGMAKFTRDERSSLGGGGVKAAVIMQRLPVLAEWQQAFHQQDRRWQNFVDHLDKLPSPPKACPNNLPRSGTNAFVGRETDLANLHTQLHQSDRIAITAIRGMGGIGKTELALQYALHHLGQGTYPGGICWLQTKEQDIGTEIVNFALVYLNLTPPDGLDLPSQVAYIWNHWPTPVGAHRRAPSATSTPIANPPNEQPDKDLGQKAQDPALGAQPCAPTPGDVLVVIDDVSGPDEAKAYNAIKPYLPPQETHFRVLLTTRLQLGTSIQTVQIDVLNPAAALELLTSLIGADRVNRELDTAKALCQWLGYLPLGLELVGRILARKRGWSLAKMQQQLDQKRLEAKPLTQAQADMTAAHESIAAAFELSWQDLEPEAQELAYRLCLYALAPIDWQWIEQWYEDTDPDELEDWRDEGLVNRSLLNLDSDSNTVQLHQIIREFFRAKLELWAGAEGLKRAYGQAMVQVAQQIPQTPTRDQILAVTTATPHLAEAATTWQRWLEDESLIWPFAGLGRFYEGQGAYGQAEPWWQDCLAVTRDRLGEAHPDVATSLNNLAELYRSQGRYSEAEPLYQEALALRKQLLGEAHPDVANSLNNLALLYKSQGRYSKAEPLYQEALALRKQLLGEAHPDVASSLNNLAALYRSQGRYSEAEPLYQEALALSKQLLGEAHPDVAQSLNNLAALYYSQGRYSEAEPLYLQAISVVYQRLGENHPNTQRVLGNFVGFLQSVIAVGQAPILSDHPLTQGLLQQVQGQSPPS
jgi:tetratricopeptide (TPR) repeat protein